MDCVEIKLEGICLSLGGKLVLNNVSLTTKPATITAIYGKSGSGKTSLLNVMNGLYVPESGIYSVGGRKVDFYDEALIQELRRNVGYFHQELALIENLTLMQNLTIFAEIQEKELDERYVKSCLNELGITHLYDRNVSTLSGGERQRAAFCKLVVFEYPVVLIDEPTNNLDSENIDYILRAIQLLKEKGKNVIVVSHSDKVTAIADYVFVMEELNEKNVQ